MHKNKNNNGSNPRPSQMLNTPLEGMNCAFCILYLLSRTAYQVKFFFNLVWRNAFFVVLDSDSEEEDDDEILDAVSSDDKEKRISTQVSVYIVYLSALFSATRQSSSI